MVSHPFLNHFHSGGVRSRLALLVAACILPIALVAAMLVYIPYERERSLVRDSSISRTRAMVSALDRDFARIEAALLALSTSPFLASNNLADFHAQARQALRNINADSIVLLDASGQMLLTTRRAFGEPLPRLDYTPLLRRITVTGKPGVSDLYPGPLAGDLLVRIGVPVHIGGSMAYSLYATVAPARLSTVLSEQKLPLSWRAAIADSTGNVVARSHDVDRFLGRPVMPELLQRLGVSNEDAFEAKTLEGIAVLTTYSRSRLNDWTAVVGTPLAELNADIRLTFSWLLAATCAALGIGLALAWLIGGRIAYSISSLVAPAKALGAGDAVVVPPLYLEEAVELGKALTKSSALLHDANDALVHGEARLRAIIESAMDAVITIDENQHIVIFNAAAEAIFGYPRHEAIGNPISRLLPERFHDVHAGHVRRFGENGAASRRMGVGRIVVGVRANGEEFPLEASISHIRELGRELYTIILRDVTERVRATEKLERSVADLEEFAFVASHDLKTPLRAISGYVQLLEKDHGAVLERKAIALIRRAARAAQKLDQLTNDLLSYARVDSRGRSFAAVELALVFDEVIKLLEVPIYKSDASITAGELPAITGDRAQLVYLVKNLVGNAIKYRGEDPPRIHVAATLKYGQWTFSVSDNGIGIEAKHHERIFEIFRRLHAQREYAGTGIGLSVCRRIVHRHGGRIWVESRPGAGSTFFFTIPERARLAPWAM